MITEDREAQRKRLIEEATERASANDHELLAFITVGTNLAFAYCFKCHEKLTIVLDKEGDQAMGSVLHNTCSGGVE